MQSSETEFVGFYKNRQPRAINGFKSFSNLAKTRLGLRQLFDRPGFEWLCAVCRLVERHQVQTLESIYQLCKLALNPGFVQLLRASEDLRGAVRTVFFESSGAVAFWAMSPNAGQMTLNMNKRKAERYAAMLLFRKLDTDLGLCRGIRWASWTEPDDAAPGSRLHVMCVLVRLKVAQHPRVAKLLESTGNAPIVERSPTDAFWGDAHGGKPELGTGENWLGRILVEVREERLQHRA